MSDYIEWRRARLETVARLRDLASDIDQIKRSGSIAKIAGASSSLLGAAIFIPCTILIPFTFGLTFIGSIIGGVISAVGGITSIGGSVGAWAHVKSKMKDMQQIIEIDKEATKRLTESSSCNFTGRDGAHIGVGVAGKLAGGVKFGADIANLALKGGDASLDAINAAVQAAKVAKVAGSVTVAIGVILIPLDIYQLVVNAMDVHKKTPHETAESIRELANNLENECIDFEASMSELSDHDDDNDDN